MLRKIMEALKEEGLPVYYGRVPQGEEIPTWNYYVFNRSRTAKSGGVNYKQYVQVHIICEDVVPEGKEMEIIKRLEEIPGVKLADDDIVFDYALKGNTDMVVEMATITFVKNIKGCE